MNLHRRTTCRVCGSSALREVINLGEQNLQGAFLKEGLPTPPMRKIPCSLVRCCPEDDENACGLLQMRHSVPPEILYSTYWYRSGTNQTMKDHLAGIVREALSMNGEKQGHALDIGCNDCTLMSYYPEGWKVSGIDPSDVPHPEGFTVIKSLFPSPAYDIQGVDIITSIAMFYDLESPVQFAKEIYRSLADDGLWIVEMSYMPRMLELNSYDTICHEHLEYYSLAVIERICREAKLKVVRAELNDSNGGSLRCYISHEESTKYDREDWVKSVRAIRVSEFDAKLDTDIPYQSFQKRIEDHRIELRQMIQTFLADGKKIHVYGASTKGNTILQWCGLDSQHLVCAADRNCDKHGATTISGIPIISEEESRAMRPDVYLVLPWHFADEFMKRESAFLKNGGWMIFPLPKPSLIFR